MSRHDDKHLDEMDIEAALRALEQEHLLPENIREEYKKRLERLGVRENWKPFSLRSASAAHGKKKKKSRRRMTSKKRTYRRRRTSHKKRQRKRSSTRKKH